MCSALGDLVAQTVNNLPSLPEIRIQATGWEDPLEEDMAAHSSILAWEIPQTEGAWWATVPRVEQGLDMT